MESPARGIRFIHEAISRELALFERLAAGGATGELAARLPFFERVLYLHTNSEEQSVFLDVSEKAPDVPASYILDHREDERQMAALKAALEAGGGPPLVRAVSVLREHVSLHIRKEEELLVPLIERHYDVAEQGAMVGRMMSTFSPEDMAAIVPWLITWLDPADRRAYVRAVERGVPPERFAGMLGMLRRSLAPDVWGTLERV